MNPTVKEYLEKNILTELGIENLPPAEIEKLLDSIGSVIQGRIQLRILDALSPADKEEFHRLIEVPKADAEVDTFFRRTIPNLDELVATVIAESKQEIVERTKALNSL